MPATRPSTARPSCGSPWPGFPSSCRSTWAFSGSSTRAASGSRENRPAAGTRPPAPALDRHRRAFDRRQHRLDEYFRRHRGTYKSTARFLAWPVRCRGGTPYRHRGVRHASLVNPRCSPVCWSRPSPASRRSRRRPSRRWPSAPAEARRTDGRLGADRRRRHCQLRHQGRRADRRMSSTACFGPTVRPRCTTKCLPSATMPIPPGRRATSPSASPRRGAIPPS